MKLNLNNLITFSKETSKKKKIFIKKIKREKVHINKVMTNGKLNQKKI